MLLEKSGGQPDTNSLMTMGIAAAETRIMKPGGNENSGAVFGLQLVIIRHLFTCGSHTLGMLQVVVLNAFADLICKNIRGKIPGF